jgi:hypothetical protein
MVFCVEKILVSGGDRQYSVWTQDARAPHASRFGCPWFCLIFGTVGGLDPRVRF